MRRALVLGMVMALVVILAVAVFLWAGVITIRDEPTVPQRVLVMGTSPDAEGVDVVSFAFVAEREQQEAELLDVGRLSTVSGTSANSARDALPFVGEPGMAEVFGPQTGGVALPWISVPASSWAELADARGGVVVDVPSDISVYRAGSLVVLSSGKQNLRGEELIAAAAATDLLPDQARAALLRDLSEGMSEIILDDFTVLAGFVGDGRAASSLRPQQLSAFAKPK